MALPIIFGKKFFFSTRQISPEILELLLHEVGDVLLAVGPRGQDLDPGFCHDHGLFELSREFTVDCHRGPVVGPRLVRPNPWNNEQQTFKDQF